MAPHNAFGKLGEKLAANWLIEKGYEILHQNWRYSWYEIDIIAKKENTLHIIEVKVRKHSPFGFPEESVSKKKFRKLKKAITFFTDREPEYLFFQDVYL
jgi:putative endonuclease